MIASMGLGIAGSTVLGLVVAQAAPSAWVPIDGSIRYLAESGTTFGWANSGTSFDTTTCTNGGIHAVGTKGLFDCGKPGTSAGSFTDASTGKTVTDSNPVPVAPSLTAAAAAARCSAAGSDPNNCILSSTFVANPLFNSTSKNTHMLCPASNPPVYTNVGAPDTLTTGSSKNDLPFTGFQYLPGSVQPKDDLGNVYAVSHQSSSGQEVFFGGERVVNNGASHIDFEFLQSGISLVPSATNPCAGTFAGNRTQGDFLVAVDFGNGGAAPTTNIYKWECNGVFVAGTTGALICNPGTASPNAQYVPVPSTDSEFKAFNIRVNDSTNFPNGIPCGGWVCRGQAAGDTSQLVSSNEFMEGGVNLSQLNFTGCVSTFLPHTRSSPDINSTLQKFAGPIGFNSCSITTTPGAPATSIGVPISDTAKVTGFTGTPGTVQFGLYGPFSSASAITATSCSPAKLVAGFPITSTTTASGSPATYTATSPNAITAPGVYQWVATYSGGAAGVCGDGTEQANVVDAYINLALAHTPDQVNTSQNAAGETVTATVKQNAGTGSGYVAPPDGTTVNLTLTGVGSFSNNSAVTTTSCTTTAGACTVTIYSTSPGQTTVNATTTLSVTGVSLTRSTGDGISSDSSGIVKTWVDAYINLALAHTPDQVNTSSNTAGETVTATVKQNTGTGSGYVSPPDGTTVNLSIAGGSVGSFSNNSAVTTTSCTTTAGACTVTIYSTTAGQTTVNATTTLSVSGVSLTRSTGDGISSDSSGIVKTWVDAYINLALAHTPDPVGTNENVTATVFANDGSGSGYLPSNNTVVTLSILGGSVGNFVPSGSTITCTTDVTGSCTVQITSNVQGTTTVHATTTLNVPAVNGVSLTRSTSDGISLDQSDVVKTWQPLSPTLSTTPSADGLIGSTPITDKASVTGAFGAASSVDKVTFQLFGPFNAVPTSSSCTVGAKTAGYTAETDTFTGGTAGASGQSWTAITAAAFNPTTTGYYAWVATPDFTGDQSNTTPAASTCGTEVVHITPVTPNQATTPSASGPIGTATISDTDQVTGAYGAAGTADLVSFKLYGPFSAQNLISCAGTPAYSETNDVLTGGTAGLASQTWTRSTTPYTPTIAGYYAWQITASFSGDANNNNPTPNPTPCTGIGSEIVQITPVNPSLATLQSSPSGFLVNTTGSVSDTGTLTGFVDLQPGDTMTFALYGPFSGGSPVCDTANNTNRVLGPFTGAVDVGSGVASTGPQTFTPTAAGTYYWVASFSGDVNNTTLNATNAGCGDPHEAVVVTAPSALIAPTETTCNMFVGGTASTLASFNYTGTTTITNSNPGVFFYYDKVSVGAGSNTIAVTEAITSPNSFPSGESNYLLPVLNGSTSQVVLYDSSCNTVTGATIRVGPVNPSTNTYTVTIVTPSSTPAGTYVFSVKYTPKQLVGLGVPNPTTIAYGFSSSLNGTTIPQSSQGINAIKT